MRNGICRLWGLLRIPRRRTGRIVKAANRASTQGKNRPRHTKNARHERGGVAVGQAVRFNARRTKEEARMILHRVAFYIAFGILWYFVGFVLWEFPNRVLITAVLAFAVVFELNNGSWPVQI